MDVAACIDLIAARAARGGIDVAAPAAARLAQYVELLARWNRRINLTAFALDPPDDAAIDRLIVEPLAAARLIGPGDRVVLDVGSGGGSPAIPMRIAAPHGRFVLVEVKDRKSAFLREAARHLGLAQLEVRTDRLENLPAPTAADAADVVTIRAVRMDDAMMAAIRRQLRPGGRVLWFRSAAVEEASVPRGLRILTEHPVLDARIAEGALE